MYVKGDGKAPFTPPPDCPSRAKLGLPTVCSALKRPIQGASPFWCYKLREPLYGIGPDRV